MTKVKFNEARIIPAPFVSFQRNFVRLDNGDIIGENYQITVVGKIIAYKGSPNSDGDFWYLDGYPEDESLDEENIIVKSRLARILGKQEALKKLFSKENIGRKFEIIPEDGISPIYFRPLDIEISFADGPWYDTCDYTINIQTNMVSGLQETVDLNEIKITSASETWSIEPTETPISINLSNLTQNEYGYRISHSLSAQGLTYYTKKGGLTVIGQPEEIEKNSGFIEAKKWVTNRTGYGFITTSGFLSQSPFKAYNHFLTENLDSTNDTYSINENWIFGKKDYIEEYTIQASTSEGLTRVTIDGTVTGLEERVMHPSFLSGDKIPVITSPGYTKAKARFNILQPLLHNIAQTESGKFLNPVSLTNTVGRNPYTGTINFSFEYDNRPCFYIDGAQSENIIVNYGYNSKRFAAIPVLGRNDGPVLQALGTSDAKTKSLNIDFILSPRSGCDDFNVSDFEFPLYLVQDLVDQLDPINNGAQKSFYDQPQSSWNPSTRAGSFSVNWTWE